MSIGIHWNCGALEQQPKRRRHSAGSNLWVNARNNVICTILTAMWVSAIIADGAKPAGTLKPHGTNQLKLASKANH